MDTPTARQTKVLQAIDASYLKRWRGPTLREILDALELPATSTMAAVDHLAALERKGYAERLPGITGGVRLTAAGQAWVRRAK